MWTLLAILLLTATAAPQEAPRDPGFGRVLGGDGEPWADAEVHLLHRPHEAVVDPSVGEHLVLRSDDKGVFRTSLLVGAAYVAWAIGPVATDSSYAVTAIAKNQVARTPILLHRDEPHFVRRFRPVLHASWDGEAPLRWRAATYGAPGLSVWLEPDADGAFVTPAWPGRGVTIEAWSGDSLAVSTGFWTTPSMATRSGLRFFGKEKVPADEVTARLTETYELPVGERRTREITLRDGTTSAPIADAALRLDAATPDLPTPRSDATGVVRIVHADEGDGRGKVPGRWTILPPGANAEFALAPSATRAGDPPLTERELPPGRRLDGRLCLAADEPAPDVPILLEGSVATGEGGMWFGIEPRVFASAADGSFSIPGRSTEFTFRLTAALSPTMRARLAAREDAAPVAPLAVLRWAGGDLPEALGDIALRGLVPLDIEVRQPDGTPPGSTRVLLKAVTNDRSAPHEPVAVDTDHRGRVRVLVPHTDDVLVHAMTANGAAWRRLERGAQAAPLTIDPRHVVRFRVVDGQGKAVPGALVRVVTVGGAFGGGGPVDSSIRDMCLVNAFPLARGTADANGLGVLVAPVIGTELDLFIGCPDRPEQRVALSWQGPEGDAPVDLVVR